MSLVPPNSSSPYSSSSSSCASSLSSSSSSSSQELPSSVLAPHSHTPLLKLFGFHVSVLHQQQQQQLPLAHDPDPSHDDDDDAAVANNPSSSSSSPGRILMMECQQEHSMPTPDQVNPEASTTTAVHDVMIKSMAAAAADHKRRGEHVTECPTAEDQDDNTTASPQHLRRRQLYDCNFCSRKFASSQALGGHQNAHKRERQQQQTKSKKKSPTASNSSSSSSPPPCSTSSASMMMMSSRATGKRILLFHPNNAQEAQAAGITVPNFTSFGSGYFSTTPNNPDNFVSPSPNCVPTTSCFPSHFNNTLHSLPPKFQSSHNPPNSSLDLCLHL